jgi:monoamine oxidase
MAGASYDAIVIGGGVAGIVAARELEQSGRGTLLLEARDRLGGRTWYRPFAGERRKVEFGGAWISPRTMHRAAAEIDRYGLRLTQRRAPGATFRWRVGERVTGAFPLEGDELYELEQAWYWLIAASRRLAPDNSLDQQGLADVDRPVGDFLRSLEVSERTRTFLELWARLGSGAESSEWSALQLLAWIAAFGFSVLAYFAEVSRYLEAGTSSLIDAIVSDGGFEVELAAPVVRIRDLGDEVAVTTASGRELRAASAVVAVPVNVWRFIDFEPELTGAKLNLAISGHAGRMEKVWIHARRVPANVIAIGADTGFVWLSAEYEVDDGVLLVGFAGPPRTVDATDRGAVVAAVAELLPEAEVLAVDSHDWVADAWSRGTWLVPRVGWLSTCWSEVQAPVGRIAFAGADIATRWLGWIDGAIESGQRSAAHALAIDRLRRTDRLG